MVSDGDAAWAWTPDREPVPAERGAAKLPAWEPMPVAREPEEDASAGAIDGLEPVPGAPAPVRAEVRGAGVDSFAPLVPPTGVPGSGAGLSPCEKEATSCANCWEPARSPLRTMNSSRAAASSRQS